LLDTMDQSRFSNTRGVVRSLCNVKYSYRPFLEKCNRVFLLNLKELDTEHFSIILGLYQSLQFNNCDFQLAAKQRLTELINTCTDPVSFTKLFAALRPMAAQETRERLESTALLLADELNCQQALAVVETMEEMECRNSQLINKYIIHLSYVVIFIQGVDAVLPPCNLSDLNAFAVAITKWVQNDHSYWHTTSSV
ncbi:FAKD1 protein, partial [Polyodon spathula]|nr:FAKD1 protein [Polyodon spathula]